MKKSKGIIILGIIVLYFGIMAIINVNKQKGDNELILKEVTYVTDGIVDSKNEGKLVVVSGKYVFDSDITFLELEKPIHSFKATRHVYDFIEKENPSGSKSHEWKEREEVKEAEEIETDFIAKDYMDTIVTEQVTKDVNIGSFELNDEALSKVNASKRFLDDKIEVGGLKFEGLSYTTTGDSDDENVGDMRIIYEYFDTTKTDTLSVLAKQVGNTFEAYELGTGTKVFNVYESSITNEEELAKALNTDVGKTKKGKSLFIIMIIAVGAVLIIDSKKGNSDNKENN